MSKNAIQRAKTQGVLSGSGEPILPGRAGRSVRAMMNVRWLLRRNRRLYGAAINTIQALAAGASNFPLRRTPGPAEVGQS